MVRLVDDGISDMRRIEFQASENDETVADVLEYVVTWFRDDPDRERHMQHMMVDYESVDGWVVSIYLHNPQTRGAGR